MARISQVQSHFRAFRSLMLRACLGFASGIEMLYLRSGSAKTVSSFSHFVSDKGFWALDRVEVPTRRPDPHKFPQVPNRKHLSGLGFSAAARSPALEESRAGRGTQLFAATVLIVNRTAGAGFAIREPLSAFSHLEGAEEYLGRLAAAWQSPDGH
jgi:hypothetical protein